LAIKPADNETFYREVDEELRREQMASVWKRYGLWMIAGVILLLAAIGGAIWWQNRQEVEAGERAELLTGVFEDIQAGRGASAAPKLDQLASEGSDGYRAAALLTKGALAVEAGKDAEAVSAYKAVAADEDIAQPYRDLALIRQTAVEFDTIAPALVIERLKPMAVAGNPWLGSAGELVAIAYLKQQKPELAGQIFAAMAKDEAVPQSIRSRAVQMAGALGVDAVQQPGEAGAAAATKEGTR
jgi:hypothetical protein